VSPETPHSPGTTPHRSQLIYVAEDANLMAGFMSLTQGGCIDFTYIRFEYRGHGLFRRLYEKIESHALASDVAELWVHASLTAQPAFSTLGFTVVMQETVNIGDQKLKRFEMRKLLTNNTAESAVRQ
jgi:putative acetyltransferase